MIRRILRRFFLGFFVLFLTITFTFFLMKAVPGGPFYGEKSLPEEVRRNLEEKFGLTEPLSVQYMNYLKNSFLFDFGPSMKYRGREVREIIFSTFPVSLKLGILALIVSLFTGIPAGIYSAIFSRKILSRFLDALSTAGISFPSFVLAIFLIYLFSVFIPLFPPALWESPYHVILPVLSLSIAPASVTAKLIKTGARETLSAHFINAVRGRGIGGFRFTLHLLRPSLATFFGILGPLFAVLITGSFVVEQIFSVPGLGRYFVLSVMNRDYPLIMGITVFYCDILIIANIISDILFTIVDPRTRGEAV